MQLRIVHTSDYEYDGHAVASYNQARLTPPTNSEQIVLHTRLEVNPKPWIYEYRDYFGTFVTAFELLDPHEAMRVVATSTVQVNRPPTREPSLTWDGLTAGEVADRWTEYLTLPALVEPPEDFLQRAKEIAASSELPGHAARRLCALVNDEVEHLPGATDVHSDVRSVWEQRSGVCQDMTHLAIGGLRALGIPARYVSGYFHPRSEPAVGETVTGESHAWVEWWDDGWHPFDVANDQEPSDHYVLVATGRDYHDVKPLSGLYSGAATSRMVVSVDVTRLA